MTREEKIDRLICMELERMKHEDLLRIAEEQLFAELRDEDDEHIDYLYDRHDWKNYNK